MYLTVGRDDLGTSAFDPSDCQPKGFLDRSGPEMPGCEIHKGPIFAFLHEQDVSLAMSCHFITNQHDAPSKKSYGLSKRLMNEIRLESTSEEIDLCVNRKTQAP